LGYTYATLAAMTYLTDHPTRAQMSAIRRSVDRLVYLGMAQLGNAAQYPSRIVLRGPELRQSVGAEPDSR
jgi:hypothetical protein